MGNVGVRKDTYTNQECLSLSSQFAASNDDTNPDIIFLTKYATAFRCGCGPRVVTGCPHNQKWPRK
jgi:hypothetical protein